MIRSLMTGALALCLMGMGVEEPKKAAIGEKVADFKLVDTEGNEHALSQFTKEDKIVVLEWFNPDCPVVKGYHKGGAESRMAKTVKATTKDHEVVWIAVNSGAKGKQGHGAERNEKARKDWNLEYPVLLDESGKVGKMMGATNTPQIFIIDTENVLRYMGAVDSADRKTNYVVDAVHQIAHGETVTTERTRAKGCGVKY